MARNVSTSDVMGAIDQFHADSDNTDALAQAVRLSLAWFASAHPGRAVELRVPPYGAVQILEGTTHRRGTPSAVVEMSPATWIALFTHATTWEAACATGRVLASGARSDLTQPLTSTPYGLKP
jgi:hypothetical protein